MANNTGDNEVVDLLSDDDDVIVVDADPGPGIPAALEPAAPAGVPVPEQAEAKADAEAEAKADAEAEEEEADTPGAPNDSDGSCTDTTCMEDTEEGAEDDDSNPGDRGSDGDTDDSDDSDDSSDSDTGAAALAVKAKKDQAFNVHMRGLDRYTPARAEPDLEGPRAEYARRKRPIATPDEYVDKFAQAFAKRARRDKRRDKRRKTAAADDEAGPSSSGKKKPAPRDRKKRTGPPAPAPTGDVVHDMVATAFHNALQNAEARRKRNARSRRRAREVRRYNEDDDLCFVCHNTEHHGTQAITCPGCDATYHLLCLDPPLEAVPEDGWLCPDCDPPQEGEGDEGDEPAMT